ncbi:MAG: hypothetical protein ACLPV8_11440 [Steroidobacteraceae bacterium]
MKPWIRNTLVAVSVLVVMAGAAYYWLILESHMPADAQYALDIGEDFSEASRAADAAC